MRSKKPDTDSPPELVAGRWADHDRHGREYLAEPDWPRCSVKECPRPRWAKDLCSSHYRMLRIYGVTSTGWHDPDNIRQRRIEFLWANIDVRGDDECWPWKRKPTTGGYGQLRWFTGQRSAHGAVYELTYGEIPRVNGKRIDLDHTCHDSDVCKLKTECPHRLCCNPSHLEAVPRRINLERSDTSRPHNEKGSSKCAPGCTCKRHQAYSHTGGFKCEPGCTCARHASRVNGGRPVQSADAAAVPS